MNEIEKMYKNARIEQKYCNKVCEANKYPYQGWCKGCKYLSIKYPPFTAEKQIEIIKFLIGKHARFDMFKNYEQKDLYMVHYECRYFPKQYLPFGEALAESINYLWQSLTEKEKQQITDILK